MDLLGPLPTPSAGNKWITVATDYVTWYAETEALKRGTVFEATQFFITKVVLLHGARDVIITDRGNALNAGVVEEIVQLSVTPTGSRLAITRWQTNRLNA